jgi:hypothetical protein
MCCLHFNIAAPDQCEVACTGLAMQGVDCGDCCQPPTDPDPCNVTLDEAFVGSLYWETGLFAAPKGAPSEADVRQAMSAKTLALLLVDRGGAFHFVVGFARDVAGAYTLGDPAVDGGGPISQPWSRINGGAGIQCLWTVRPRAATDVKPA